MLGRDSTTDLVLLALDSDDSRTGTNTKPTAASGHLGVPAPFAARAPQAGDIAWIVGAPTTGDTSPWMSSGMVASTDSLVAVASGPTTSGLLEMAAISTSASSGGALVNRSGDVTGIVLAPVGDDPMTYAVPISTALAIADDLQMNGYATHGALGVSGTDGPGGPTVTGVVRGGPAAHAGIHVGDVIDAVGGHEVYSMDDVMALVRHDRPGDSVPVEVERGSRSIRVTTRLAGMVTP